MQWLKIDSLVADNEKWLAIDDPAAELLLVHIWLICSKNETDGRVEPHLLKRAGFNAHVTTPAKLRTLTRKLTAIGMLHNALTATSCDACAAEFGDVADDVLVVHNWNDWNPSQADKVNESQAFKANRRRQLKRLKALKEEIRRRDRDYCRYCGFRINMSDHSSDDGGCLDHIDPDGPNSLENLVRSCRGCNLERKGERTPYEAGMVMLPPPTPGQAPPIAAWRLADDPYGRETGRRAYPLADEPEWWTHSHLTAGEPGPKPGPDPGPDPVQSRAEHLENPGPNPGPPSRDAQLGSEPARSRLETGSGPGSGPGSGQLGTALVGLAGLGRGLPGAGLAGLVRVGSDASPSPSSTTEPNDATSSTATDPRSDLDG